MSSRHHLPKLRRHVWNWLPAFLEVAETGAIKEAARRLHLTPAAVSRTLRLLQEELGTPLFNRVGRNLVLNATGAALRDTIRSAALQVDLGLSGVLGDPFVGPLCVSSIGLLTDHFVMPCLIDIKAEHDQLVPEHLNIGTVDANTRLLRGELDVAFYYEDVSAPEIVVERIGQTAMSVYCGKRHPLFRQKRVLRSQLLAYPFSVPQIGDTGRVLDGWPTEFERSVGMRITRLSSNLQVALSGVQLTVLPDVTAADGVKAGHLRRFTSIELPTIEMFAVRNNGTAERAATRKLIDAVRLRIEETNRSLKKAHRSRK